MRILSVDFGLKRIGIAIGDTAINSASPLLPIIRKTKDDVWVQIKDLVEEYTINKIIVGYPVNMDGTPSQTTKMVEKFFNHLKQTVDVDIELIDERLTSVEADEILKSYQSDYKKRKKFIDSISALVILRSYMENSKQYD